MFSLSIETSFGTGLSVSQDLVRDVEMVPHTPAEGVTEEMEVLRVQKLRQQARGRWLPLQEKEAAGDVSPEPRSPVSPGEAEAAGDGVTRTQVTSVTR